MPNPNFPSIMLIRLSIVVVELVPQVNSACDFLAFFLGLWCPILYEPRRSPSVGYPETGEMNADARSWPVAAD
jgi:hypothetical protein